MNAASRPISAGKTRVCPHCKATILESLSICPGCLHHLRVDPEAARRQSAAKPTLAVEGIVSHPPQQETCEYYVVLAVRNDRGDEISRQVMSVGCLRGGERRTFALSVELLPTQVPPLPKPAVPEPAAPPSSEAPSGDARPKPRVGGYDLKPPGLKPADKDKKKN
jgi:hypothetical protein